MMSLVVFGALPALAVNTNDSPSWEQSNPNYVNILVGGSSGSPPTPDYTCASFGGDADNDGICDNWETSTGLHISVTSSASSSTPVTYVYNISCVQGNTISNDPTGLTVCPSPNKKDIYMELDYMTGQGPDSQAIADVVKAFDKQGIALHIQYGENPSSNSGDIGLHYCFVNPTLLRTVGTAGQACSTTTTNYQSYPWLKQNTFGTTSERSGNTTICPSNALPQPPPTVTNANSYNCLTAKRQVFHYAMFVNYQWNAVPSSGWGEITGNDIIISLGNFENGVGSIDRQEAEIMHELGHNFGLQHGGRTTSAPFGPDPTNCKPNYPSVMSYTYLFRKAADICRPLDYSNNALSNLAEGSLQDSNIGSYQYPSDNPPPPSGTSQNQPTSCPTSGQREIFWSHPTLGNQSGTAGVTNDWNRDGINSNTYTQDLNNFPALSCSSGTQTTLTGYNDWNYIKNGDPGNTQPLNFRPSGNFYQVAPQADLGHDLGIDSHSDFTSPDSLVINNPGNNPDNSMTYYVAAGIAAAIVAIGVPIAAKRRKRSQR